MEYNNKDIADIAKFQKIINWGAILERDTLGLQTVLKQGGTEKQYHRD